jgi:hypothetical protein
VSASHTCHDSSWLGRYGGRAILQAIGAQLNAEGVPTLSHKGQWQKGTIGNLLAQL